LLCIKLCVMDFTTTLYKDRCSSRSATRTCTVFYARNKLAVELELFIGYLNVDGVDTCVY